MLLVGVSLRNLLPLLLAAAAAGGWRCRWEVAAAGRLWFVFIFAMKDFLDCVEGILTVGLLACVCGCVLVRFWVARGNVIFCNCVHDRLGVDAEGLVFGWFFWLKKLAKAIRPGGLPSKLLWVCLSLTMWALPIDFG